MAPVGEPKQGVKAAPPMGSLPLIALLTICMIVMLVALWRRADSLRRVVSHQLKNLTGRREGHIRLDHDAVRSPTASEFLDDDDEGESLPAHIEDGMDAIRKKTVLPPFPDSREFPDSEFADEEVPSRKP